MNGKIRSGGWQQQFAQTTRDSHKPTDIAAGLHLVRQTANKHWLNGALFPFN